MNSSVTWVTSDASPLLRGCSGFAIAAGTNVPSQGKASLRSAGASNARTAASRAGLSVWSDASQASTNGR